MWLTSCLTCPDVGFNGRCIRIIPSSGILKASKQDKTSPSEWQQAGIPGQQRKLVLAGHASMLQKHVSTSAVELKEDMVYVWLLNSGKLSKTTSRHLPVDRRQVYLGS